MTKMAFWGMVHVPVQKREGGGEKVKAKEKSKVSMKGLEVENRERTAIKKNLRCRGGKKKGGQ